VPNLLSLNLTSYHCTKDLQDLFRLQLCSTVEFELYQFHQTRPDVSQEKARDPRDNIERDRQPVGRKYLYGRATSYRLLRRKKEKSIRLYDGKQSDHRKNHTIL
jgi:hypothetical protein